MPTIAATGVSSQSTTSEAAAEAYATAIAGLGGAAPTMGVLLASPRHRLDAALGTLRQMAPQAEFVACSTAGEFTERGLTRGGLALLLLASDEMLVHVRKATEVRQDPARAASELCRDFAGLAQTAGARGWSASTSMMLVDGLNGAGEELVGRVLEASRSTQRVVGGAAGDDGAFKATHVGAGGESFTDAATAVHAFSPRAWGVGVDHGLRPTTDRMRVTRAEKNVVYEIDGRPAFDVYREHAGKRGVELSPESAGSFLIGNELGIYFFEKLHRARAPLSVGSDGSLTCAGEIPQGSSVCILDGEPEAMLAAARRAAEEARKGLDSGEAAAVIVFDCVCRGMILDGRFDQEIEAVKSVFPGVPVLGFLTYGEIARFKGHMDGWHNTTAVVTAIPA